MTSAAAHYAKVYIVAVLETLAETGGEAPESTLYLPFTSSGFSLDDWKLVLGVMLDSGLVTNDSHLTKLTDKGRKLAAAFAKARSGHLEAKDTKEKGEVPS